MLYLLCLLNKSNQTEKYMYILLNKNAFSNCKNALWRGGGFVSYIYAPTRALPNPLSCYASTFIYTRLVS